VLDIHIWTGPAWETWSPDSLSTGIGGSETAAIQMSKHLTQRGHKVTVHGVVEGTWDDVTYVHYGNTLNRSIPIPCDVLVTSRQPFILHENKFRARASFIWAHDVNVGLSTEVNEALFKADRILALSEWHRSYLKSVYPFLPDHKIFVTRNGIDTDLYARAARKTGNRLIYASSPDRGIERLLQLFPQIQSRVPDVELHVYYGFNTWEAMADHSQNQAQRQKLDYYKRMLIHQAPAGVHFHGRVGQEELASAYLASKVLAYCTWFSETSCISAMEAQAAGCVPVTTALAALRETVKHGLLIDPPDDSPDYARTFIENVVTLLTNDGLRLRLATTARYWALSSLSWRDVALQWEELFGDLLNEKKRLTTLYVPPYEGA